MKSPAQNPAVANTATPNTDALTLTRRSFMIGSVAGGLVMAFGGLIASGSARAELAARRFSPAVWFEMDAEGRTLVNIAKAEMGQHVGTALARILADELGLAWSDVHIRYVDSDPRWGYMITGGSWSVWTSFTLLSQAGAAGRLVLLEQGARLMGVAADTCQVGDSRVRCGEQSISFGEIVQRGEIDRVFTAEELAALPVKPAQDRTLIGKAVRA
ncbi:MAG TPA: molybdopterin cofactor-binding domain-containing protein, partial [Xanthomonadales bacterium]|nr:molybdopterin cofactor-binding domain-containing protein [Xanthomonadales bacterium]